MRSAIVKAMLAAVVLAGCGQGMVEGGLDLRGDARRAPAEFEGEQTLQSDLGTVGQTLFVNFDGDTISYGSSSSRGHTSWIVPQARGKVTFPKFDASGFGGDRARAIEQVVKMVQADYAANNLTITLTRPSSGNYTEVIVGGHPRLINEDETTAGIAPLDDRNGNANDIVFVFPDVIGSVRELANCISHEAGHSFGLDHIKPTNAIMYPVLFDGLGKFMAGYTYDDNVYQDEPALLKAAIGEAQATASPGPTTSVANNSVFVSQTVPTTVEAGAQFTAKVVFKNTGTQAWTRAAGFAIYADDATFGGSTVSVSSTANVKTGSQYTFGFYAKAPTTPGTYTFQWQVGQAGSRFGALSRPVTVTVTAPANAAPAATPPTGGFDSATASGGSGWAFDVNSPSSPVRVDVYIDGQYVGYVTANRVRSDLVSARKTPDAYHGFSFQMPDVAAGSHTIEVYGVDDSDGYAYKLGQSLSFTK